MIETSKPPPTLAGCRVLKYAILDNSVSYSGHNRMFRGNEEVALVPCLAIGQNSKEPGVTLFLCDRDWTVVFSSTSASVEDAKSYAEDNYPGISAFWTDAHVTEPEAARHLEEIWGPMRCNFCGKTPLEFESPRFIEKNGAWICEACVRVCYELLQEDDQGS